MKRIRALRFILVATVLVGCDTAICTLAACSSALTVVFPQPITGPVTINFTSPDAASRSVACNNPCSIVHVENYAPANVRIEVVSATSTIARDFTPGYTRVEPNGPDCGPVCFQGGVQFN